MIGLIALLTSGNALTQGAHNDLALTNDERKEIDRELQTTYPFDRQAFSKEDLPPRAIKTATTAELVSKLVGLGGITVFCIQYTNPNMGIYRASKVCNSFRELLVRPDLADGFASFFQTLQLDFHKNKTFSDPGRLSLALLNSELLLQYPDSIRKCAGHEKELLRGLSRDFWGIRSIDQAGGSNEYVYGPGLWQSTASAAVVLLKRAEPSAALSLPPNPTPRDCELVFKTVDAYLAGQQSSTSTM